MRIIFNLYFFLFSATFAYASSDWRDLNLVNGCQIFNSKGDSLKVLPGEFCQFYEDGNLLTATNKSLKLMDKFSAIQWEMKGNFHHQLNKSADGKRILVLDMNQVKTKSIYRWVDKFMVLSLEGKVLFQGESIDLKKQVKFNIHSDEQITHINSFYEIPKLKTDRTLPNYIKEGNFILNAYKSGIFILSPDLKTVLHHRTLPSASIHQVHDVQVSENGNLLYFNNLVADAPEDGPSSAIQEYDLIENKVVFEFTSNPKSLFFSLFCGGVQQLDQDLILFSHMLTGTYIYSKETKSVISSIYKTHFKHRTFLPAQQIKAWDLKKFLSHWTP